MHADYMLKCAGYATGGHLTAAKRNSLPSSDFALPDDRSAVFNLATATGTVVLTPMVTAANGTVSGNVDTQQALVTDAAIDTAVAAVFNSFFGGQ